MLSVPRQVPGVSPIYFLLQPQGSASTARTALAEMTGVQDLKGEK